jgi:transcriptional regulator with XRE-family HTH domain
MTIAKRVRDFRYAKGWGPDELASRAQISRTALYQIECGKTEAPRAGTLKRIARALEVSIETLMGHDEAGAVELSSYALPQPAPAPRRGPDEPRTSVAEREQVPMGRVDVGLGEARFAWGGLHQKLDDLLSSPLADSIAQIVVESHRMLNAQRPLERV